LRGYDSPLEQTLAQSRMSRETFDALISVMKKRISIFEPYFRKKARMLGHEGSLPFYDLFAPVGEDLRFSYDEAADFICRCFGGFSGKLADFARTAFESGWIDAGIRKGKRGGAFCENIHSIGQSRIMANYSGSFNDALTLAHELGHAYHGECLKGETYLNSAYPMPIAETASTFCETLICDAAAAEFADREGAALSALENDISGSAQVIVDIYSRFLFEDTVIKSLKNGPLSPRELKETMLAAQAEAYGDALDKAFPHPYMWIVKPHYYSADFNYYNFPYAFGQMLSKGLFGMFKSEGAAFAKKFDRLLSITGKSSLEETAAQVGEDIAQESFWNRSMDIIEAQIDRFANA
jgi:pepF/M3 family oligoendopeptidase